jgi:hypothetical protein
MVICDGILLLKPIQVFHAACSKSYGRTASSTPQVLETPKVTPPCFAVAPVANPAHRISGPCINKSGPPALYTVSVRKQRRVKPYFSCDPLHCSNISICGTKYGNRRVDMNWFISSEMTSIPSHDTITSLAEYFQE